MTWHDIIQYNTNDTLYSGGNTNYPAIVSAIKAALSKLHLPHLPQDCVVLCNAGISPVCVGAELGQGVQVFHGGVEYYNWWGKAEPHYPSEEEEQEKVVMGWLEGEGGCLVTHTRSFSGCEAGTAVLVFRRGYEAGLRSGLLRGIARLVFITHKKYYNKKKLSQDFDVIELWFPFFILTIIQQLDIFIILYCE